MVYVKVKSVEKVQLTEENELELLDNEYSRRYEDSEFEIGDTVRFTDNGRFKQQQLLGDDHIGRLGIVVALGDDGGAKVLAINPRGDFVEVWTNDYCLEKVGE